MKLRALIFDDEALLRHLLRTVLEQRGYEVFAYPEPGVCPLNGLGGCPCPPDTICADVIISDVRMPGTNGLDFIRQLMENKCRRPHFAVMSGDWTDVEMERAARLGCKVFKKPIRLAEFIAWLQHVENIIAPERRLFDWHHRVG
jgi:CheY-like chemotaxis protein